MTYGGPEFIKMIQKNNKKTYIYILLVLAGGGWGQDKLAWTACPPGVKITRVGARYPRTACPTPPPPQGTNCPGGQDKLYTALTVPNKSYNTSFA